MTENTVMVDKLVQFCWLIFKRTIAQNFGLEKFYFACRIKGLYHIILGWESSTLLVELKDYSTDFWFGKVQLC